MEPESNKESAPGPYLVLHLNRAEGGEGVESAGHGVRKDRVGQLAGGVEGE